MPSTYLTHFWSHGGPEVLARPEGLLLLVFTEIGRHGQGEEEDLLAGDGADVMVGVEERKESYCIPRTARYDSSGGKAVSQLFAALPLKSSDD